MIVQGENVDISAHTNQGVILDGVTNSVDVLAISNCGGPIFIYDIRINSIDSTSTKCFWLNYVNNFLIQGCYVVGSGRANNYRAYEASNSYGVFRNNYANNVDRHTQVSYGRCVSVNNYSTGTNPDVGLIANNRVTCSNTAVDR